MAQPLLPTALSSLMPAQNNLEVMPESPTAPAKRAVRDRRQRVQSAEMGMLVLKGLAQLGGRASLSHLAAHVQHSPAKLHRYLTSLQEEGVVCQDGSSQQYYLGHEAILIGLAAIRQAAPLRLAEPALVQLCEGFGMTSFIAVLGNKGPTVVRMEEPALPVTINVRVGSVLSWLWSATGRAFLGFLPEQAALPMAQLEWQATPKEQRDLLPGKQPLLQLRQAVRAHACVIVTGTNLPGVSALSAPVYGHDGQMCAALTMLGSSGSFDAALDAAPAKAVLAQAQHISQQLGFAKI